MRMLAVYTHPSFRCFGRCLLDTLVEAAHVKKYSIDILDLYQEGFDPVPNENDFEAFNRTHTPGDIQAMQERVAAADMVALIHPLWWFGMPAMLRGWLKGWIDRVFSMVLPMDMICVVSSRC